VRRTMPVAIMVALALAGCRPAELFQDPTPTVQPAPPPPTADALPTGTVFNARLDQRLSATESNVGDRFTATVTQPIVAANGHVAVPEGAQIHGVVTGTQAPERSGDQAAIRVNFERLTFQGRSVPFNANVVDTDARLQQDRLARAATGAVIGGATGAVLGAVIGGELRDILIGGAIGAGAGTILSLGLGNVEPALAAGTVLTVQTNQHVALR
jgi:outer membrane lipoprotein SlyB